METIRSKDAQQAYEASVERLKNPSLLDLWNGFVETGLTVNFTSLYTKTDVGNVSTLGAEAVRVGEKGSLAKSLCTRSRNRRFSTSA